MIQHGAFQMSDQLCVEGHAMYAFKVLTKEYDVEHIEMEHNRDQAMFLCLGILSMCGQKQLIAAVRGPVIQQIKKCILDSSEDVQNLMTSIQSAVYVGFELREVVDPQELADRILALQQPDGSFASSAEPNSCPDSRNITDALISLYLLSLRYQIDLSAFNVGKTVAYLDAIQTPDGAIGMVPDSESHGGAAFLSVCPRVLMQRMFGITWTPSRRLINRLVSYQQMFISGRPNKPPCLCYNLWVYGSLKMLGMERLLNLELLIQNTLKCYFYIEIGEEQRSLLRLAPEKPFEQCSTQPEFFAFLARKYDSPAAGFVLNQDKPDPLHTYTPLIMLAGEGLLGEDVKIDFATFQEERNLRDWRRQ